MAGPPAPIFQKPTPPMYDTSSNPAPTGRPRRSTISGTVPSKLPTVPHSKRRLGTPGASSLPPDWHPTRRTTERLADELGVSPEDLLAAYLPGFLAAAARREFMYRRWDTAFSNCVRADWLRVRTT